MAGVGGVMKLVRQVLGNWKVGKSCELKLYCEAGVMKVTLSADLGSWVQPQAQHRESGDSRSYQSPQRRRAGPSYLQRQMKRAAARATADATEAEQTDQDKTKDAATAPPSAAAATATPGSQQVTRTCKKCGQPCRGHDGPTGAKCRNAHTVTSTPEKLRDIPSTSTSLLVTPVKGEVRIETCWNCGAVMSPTHQCGEDEESFEEKEKVFKVITQYESENIMACKGREEKSTVLKVNSKAQVNSNVHVQ